MESQLPCCPLGVMVGHKRTLSGAPERLQAHKNNTMLHKFTSAWPVTAQEYWAGDKSSLIVKNPSQSKSLVGLPTTGFQVSQHSNPERCFYIDKPVELDLLFKKTKTKHGQAYWTGLGTESCFKELVKHVEASGVINVTFCCTYCAKSFLKKCCWRVLDLLKLCFQ